MASSVSKKELSARLQATDSKELVRMIIGLYDMSRENKLFLTTRLAASSGKKALLGPYKEIIEENMCFSEFGGEISIKSAKKAISDYRKASGDEDGVLELMVYFLERGTMCILEYGNMYESFYDSLESMAKSIVKKVKGRKDYQSVRKTMEPRFRKLRDDADGLGWGYGDAIAEIYYELFE